MWLLYVFNRLGRFIICVTSNKTRHDYCQNRTGQSAENRLQVIYFAHAIPAVLQVASCQRPDGGATQTGRFTYRSVVVVVVVPTAFRRSYLWCTGYRRCRTSHGRRWCVRRSKYNNVPHILAGVEKVLGVKTKKKKHLCRGARGRRKRWDGIL